MAAVLTSYTPTPFPQLEGAYPQYFTNELRKISNAIGSIEDHGSITLGTTPVALGGAVGTSGAPIYNLYLNSPVFTTPTLGAATGTTLSIGSAFVTPGYAHGDIVQIWDGYPTPLTTANPSASIYRGEAINGIDTENGQNAALWVLVQANNVSHVGGGAPITQANGIYSQVTQSGTGGAVAFFGVAVGGADINGAFGSYNNVTVTHSPGSAFGYTLDLINSSGADMPWASYAPGSSGTLGLDLNCGGAHLNTAAVQMRSSSVPGQWDVGVGAYGNSVKTAFLRDDSSSATVLQATGSHTNGIDLSGATFSGDAIKLPAWTAFTPVVAAGSGTITAYTASCRYQKIGKTVTFTMTIGITTNGTGAGSIVASLPVNANSVSICAGRENALTGNMLQGYVNSSAVTIFTYSNGYPGGTGASLIVSGTYESV